MGASFSRNRPQLYANTSDILLAAYMKDNQNRRSFLRSAGSVGVLALMGLGLLGCRHSLSSPGDSPATPPPTQSSDRHHVVNMVGASGQFVFEPDRLVIQPGDTVEFVVESSGHTATAYSPELRGTSPLRIPDGAPAWDTGVFDLCWPVLRAYSLRLRGCTITTAFLMKVLAWWV